MTYKVLSIHFVKLLISKKLCNLTALLLKGGIFNVTLRWLDNNLLEYTPNCQR